MKMAFSSQRREMLLFLITNMAAVTSSANQYEQEEACLQEGGGPQVGEVRCGGSPHLTCKRDHIKMRDYMDRWVTTLNRVTSPTWSPPPPYKQALRSSQTRVS